MKVKMRPRLKTLFLFDIIFCYWVQCGRTQLVYQSTSNLLQGEAKDSIPDSTNSYTNRNNFINNTNSNYNNNNNNNNNNNDDTNALEPSISDVRSFMMEKYGRHYRLTGDSSLDDLKSPPSQEANVGKKKDKIPPIINSHVKDAELLESGISDVKSIIMEKYGRHYRLTGGSTLASKRDKGEAVIIDVTNSTRGYNESSQQSNNITVPISHDSTKNTTLNKTISLNKNTSLTSSKMNESLANANSTVNSTVESKPRPLYTNGTNKTTASKSDIGNITESEKGNITARGKLNDTVINLPITKNRPIDQNTNEVIFGSPPQTGDSENNITEEGNLTTITIDLTKGNTSAVIPGLNVIKSPVSSVDVIVDNNHNNGQAPKRSGTGVLKHKKHIVFQMSKPRIAITDFANKRKHVPHTRRSKAKYFSKPKHQRRRHHNLKTLSENIGRI